MAKKRKLKLPDLISRKIYKTGQTRGADDDVIFQNRVNRNSTVLIPFSHYQICKNSPDDGGQYENGFIVLIDPEEYFDSRDYAKNLKKIGVEVGKNALLFYYTRDHWNRFNPIKKKLKPAVSRTNPLGGHYVARVPSTTSASDERVSHGFNTSGMKGAGIRVYEYANSRTIKECRVQLEMLYWKCFDALDISVEFGMSKSDAETRRTMILEEASELKLDSIKKLGDARIIDGDSKTICPLCLEQVSARGFYDKVQQAAGRKVPDLTVTKLNLFHIRELRTGEFNHKPYNLGWGHHHCNIVTKDSGIEETLVWMKGVIKKNESLGYAIKKTK